MSQIVYIPNFTEDCRICGASPCVEVVHHQQPDTELCGIHFFNDQEMLDWSLWNDPEETI